MILARIALLTVGATTAIRYARLGVATHSRQPQTGPGDRSSEEARAFLQKRVGRFAQLNALLGGVFLVWRLVGIFAQDRHSQLQDASFWLHVLAVVLAAGGWLACRSGRRSLFAIHTIDAVAIIGASNAYVVMGTHIPHVTVPHMTVLAAVSYSLLARAIYVPSTAWRSFWIAMAVGVPYVISVFHSYGDLSPSLLAEWQVTMGPGSLTLYRTVFTITAAIWWGGTTVLTVGASKVIYGLRAEVHDQKKLGQYALEDKLGEGGMGIVYRASHALLQRPTAIKLLPTERVGEMTLARFEREVTLTARLAHPNTVTVFDYGRTPDGVFYYAMELLDGATLDVVVQKAGPMSPKRVVTILRQILGALGEAHGIGLIHRDIKPANIMLCDRGGVPDTIKVLDFGLVKQLSGGGMASLTAADAVTGTPQYMAPEALTHPDRVNERSDLYAVGAVAFLLLTGEDVFTGNTVVEICGHHLHTEPRMPSDVASQPIPEDLERLVVACLAKDQSERPQSANELRSALADCSVAGDWSELDAAQWWDEHRAEMTS